MYRYQVLLPVSFGGKSPVIKVDDERDLSLHTQTIFTMSHDIDINMGGGSMHMSAGCQMTGIVIEKQQLPPAG
jgi:hypothetical protein